MKSPQRKFDWIHDIHDKTLVLFSQLWYFFTTTTTYTLYLQIVSRNYDSPSCQNSVPFDLEQAEPLWRDLNPGHHNVSANRSTGF